MASSRSSRSDDLLAGLRAFLAAQLAAGEGTRPPSLVVAFSGGLDSSVLLHLLARLAPESTFELQAAHVHHGLSPRADEWVRHCERYCRQLDVPHQVLRVTVDRADPHGIEAAARDARYAALASLAADWIVLGHHADDQAETVLHRLVRGAGVRGAAAMRPVDSARHLLRPFLRVPRRDLEVYARSHALSWVEDDSNPDIRLTRNFLRHEVLLPLSGRFPQAAVQMSRAAAHFAEASDLLDELAGVDLQRLRPGAVGSRQFLRGVSAPRARHLLRHWLDLYGCRMPDEAALDEGLRQLRGSADAVCWAAGEWQVCAYRQTLWIEKVAQTAIRPFTWRGEAVVPWGDGELRFATTRQAGALRADLFASALQLRVRGGGERLRLAPDRPLRSIKLLCQEAGIPPWWRERLPLLWCGDVLIWVGGLGVDAACRTGAGEEGWCIDWLPASPPPFLDRLHDVVLAPT